MIRYIRTQSREQISAPHPWAFLVEWREHANLTQEQVGEKLDVSNVTVHRWESGKAPVSVKNLFRLSPLYRASSPADLMFPISSLEQAKIMAQAREILNNLPPEQRVQWLTIGETLRKAAAALAGQAADDNGSGS
jgi:transcriptional regulator with XRE-family HTH domain